MQTGLLNIYIKPESALAHGCDGAPSDAGTPNERVTKNIIFPPPSVVLGRNPNPITLTLLNSGLLKGQYHTATESDHPASCISARSLSQATANSDGAPSMMPGTASTGPYAESVSGCWRIFPMGASTTPVAASFSPPPSQQRTITSPKKIQRGACPSAAPPTIAGLPQAPGSLQPGL